MKKLLALAPAALLLSCWSHAPGRAPIQAPQPPPAAAAPVEAPPPQPPPGPPRSEVLLSRARALRADGQLAGARSRLEAALEADPASPGVRLELADVLVTEGVELERAALLVEGLEEPPDGRLSLVRGRLCETRGDDAGAAEAYAASLSVADDADVRLRRALALARLGRTGDAIVELERLRAERPGDGFVRGHLGDTYDVAGRRHEAEAELRWVAEASPGRAAGWLRLARFYEGIGRPGDARAAADKARAAGGGRRDRALRPLLPSKR